MLLVFKVENLERIKAGFIGRSRSWVSIGKHTIFNEPMEVST